MSAATAGNSRTPAMCLRILFRVYLPFGDAFQRGTFTPTIKHQQLPFNCRHFGWQSISYHCIADPT